MLGRFFGTVWHKGVNRVQGKVRMNATIWRGEGEHNWRVPVGKNGRLRYTRY
jgi:hypothetical protein